MEYSPIFNNMTAFLRIIFPSSFYAFKPFTNSKNSDKFKQLPTIYIRCLDIPPELCKDYIIDGILLNVYGSRDHLDVICERKS